jgi:hypothetical protein
MADLIQHRYFATEEAYNAATKKDTDICFIGKTGRIVSRGSTFGNAQSVLESLNSYIAATDTKISTIEGYFNKTESSAKKADTVSVVQHLTNNLEYPMLWTSQSGDTGYFQLFKSYANMTFNPAAKRITVGAGGGFRVLNGTSSQFLKADGSTDSTTYATSADLSKYIPWTGGTTTGTLAINANAIYINSETEIYLKRKFDTGDKTLCVSSNAFRPSNTDSHGYFNLGVNNLRFKNGYFSETVYANSFSGNADSATKIYTGYHEANNVNYPLIWGNSTNTTSENSAVFKSPNKLYFNPSTGYVTATGFNGKIGSSTIGNATTPIYLSNGTPTACNLPWPTDLLSNSLIQQKYLPSYVDDVLEYANLTALSAVTGETGKIYVTTDNNKVYRWTGKAYIEINSSVSTAENAVNATNATYATQLKTVRTLKIGEKSKTFDGSADVTWTLDEIGAASVGSLKNYLPLSGGTMTGGIAFNGDYFDNNVTGQYWGLYRIANSATQGVVVHFDQYTLRPYTSGNGAWNIGTSSVKWKDGYFSGTVYANTFSGNATSADTATTADNTKVIYTERLNTDCNSLATKNNRSTLCEMASTAANLPLNYYCYVLSAQGNDVTYQTQLALGETIDFVYYRRMEKISIRR